MNLNKSAFVIALDCPRKLWYNNNAYPNLNNDNAFLKALAVEGQKFGVLLAYIMVAMHKLKVRILIHHLCGIKKI